MNCNLYDVTVVDEETRSPELLAAVLNSTLVGLTKIYFGRYAGTEGNLKTEVVDVNLLEVPDPRFATKQTAAKLKDAFDRLCRRDTQPMVEEEFMECHSADRAEKLKAKPIVLPAEMQAKDRRDLDLAVFELLGVSDAAERQKLCDELYYETANHFRQIRVVEIQKQEQRTRAEGREFRTDELAADLWDALPEDYKQPLSTWIGGQVSGGISTTIPEGHANLPDAADMLDANTVFFVQPGSAKGSAKPLALPSRAHAEIVHVLAQHGLHGEFHLPRQERAVQILKAKFDARLSALAAKAHQLAHSRTSDDKKAVDLANLLQRWMINGKPKRKGQTDASA